MISKICSLFLVCVVTVASATAAERSNSVKFNGKVIDASGKAVSGAEVVAFTVTSNPDIRMSKVAKLVGKATTRKDGLFSFTTSPLDRRSRVVAVARKDGLAVGIASGRMKNDNLEILLGKPEILAGQVVNEHGKSITGATVRADIIIQKNMGHEYFSGAVPVDWLKKKTGTDGRFRFDNLPAGAKAILMVNAPGRARTLMPKHGFSIISRMLFTGTSDIRVVMQPEARISGVVVDKETTKTLKNVTLMVVPLDSDFPALFSKTLRVKDGTFNVGGLAAGRYTLIFTEDEFRTSSWAFPPLLVDLKAGENMSGVRVAGEKSGCLKVVVTDDKTRKPIAGARLEWWCMHRKDRPAWVRVLYTDKNGIADLPGLPGKYTLKDVYHPVYGGSRSDHDRVNLVAGATARVNVEVSRLPTVEGIVRDPTGKPVAGAYIGIPFCWESPAPRTDEKGQFTLAALLDLEPTSRKSDAEFEKPIIVIRDFQRGLAAVASVSTGRKMKITLNPGVNVTGRVVDSQGRPIAHAEIYVLIGSNAKGDVWSSQLNISNWADGAGRYRITNIPVGLKCKFMAKGRGCAGSSLVLEIPKDAKGRIKNKDIILERGRSVSVTVAYEKGKPIKGLRVYAAWHWGPARLWKNWEHYGGRTNAAGKLEFKDLPRTRVVLYVRSRKGIFLHRSVAEAAQSSVRMVVPEADQRK
ncbi:MAG: hypothetical protein KAV00_00145 [Phycisphaerae bacterium]|nr:hypothetical protein [Phycisphaerae bacterium]